MSNVIHHVQTDLGVHEDGLVVRKQQVIPQSFIEENHAIKATQDATFAPDVVRVARVPQSVFMEYLKERGLNFSDGMELPLNDLMAWLSARSMTDFQLTKRRL
jgi:hypothetical protein